jgi:hypothetical protein
VTQAAANGAAGQLALSGSALNFGVDEVGNTTSGQRVLVSNSGGTNINLGSIGITGAAQTDYAAAGTCIAGLLLVPGASCFLQVSFDPTAAGDRSATLQVGSSVVTLAGSGIESPSTDAPLPPWAYVVLASLLLGIAGSRQDSPAGE